MMRRVSSIIRKNLFGKVECARELKGLKEKNIVVARKYVCNSTRKPTVTVCL